MWTDQADYHLEVPVTRPLRPGTERALRGIVNGTTSHVDEQTRDFGVLYLLARRCSTGSALERCEEAAALLATSGENRPLRVWSATDEALGVVVHHVPGLGTHVADCDHDGEPYLAGIDARAIASEPTPTRAARRAAHLLGDLWREVFDIYSLTSSPAPTDERRATTAAGSGQTLPALAYQYLDAQRACTTTPAEPHDFAARDAAHDELRSRGCILQTTDCDSLAVTLPCGGYFTVR